MIFKSLPQKKKILFAVLIGGLSCSGMVSAQEPELTAAVRDLIPAVVGVTGHMRTGSDKKDLTKFGESSGFFVDERGILLTVYDIYVETETRRLCERFEITLHDGQTMDARVVAVDPVLNFAVLTVIEEGRYPKIEMAGSPEISSGDRAWAIAGTSLNEAGRAFAGVVKAEDNSSMYTEGCGNELVDTYIEFPASAYGGPLLTGDGNLIGINIPFTRKEGCEEEGPAEEHAAPIGEISRIYKLLLAYPTFEQKWLGFSVHYIDMDLMAMVRQIMNKRCGIVVEFVWPEGPAGQADIRSGDILVMINDQIIMTPTHFKGKLYKTDTNSQLELKLIRDGALLTRQVRLEKRPSWAAL